MTELLAIPAWKTPPTMLEAWVEAFRDLGHPVKVVRQDGETWMEVESLGVRAYVEDEQGHVEAINFEIEDGGDPVPARSALDAAAAKVGWELHEDDDESGVEDD